MAIKALNSIGGFSVGDTPANIILANGDITTINFSANGVSNLGPVGNVKITGGTGGYVLTTDGAGNLSWSATGSPTIIQNGNSNVTVPTGNGNVYINATGAEQWNFDTTGNLTGPAAGTANLGNAVYANFFIGSGNNLSNIQAGNITGEVANANYATYAGTAYSVSGANVSGEVANANYATYAGTAYSVSGANVSGEVANANYATYAGTAYSVSGANVSGEVANANYATYAGTANTANTVTVNAQPNITSVGTLTSLDVSGNLTAGNVDGGNLVKANNFATNGTGGDITLTAGNVVGANVVFSNSFTSNGGLVDFSTNNANVQLGNVGNVHIGGGTNGYLLTTDGAGNLSWSATASTTSISNGNSNVTIPVANGNVYINATGADQWNFDTTGNLTGPATGTANLGNLVIANYANFANDLVVQGNISNANNISVTNSIAAGSANITNDLVVQGNISNANNISVTNSIAAGSANITNDLVVQGNIANANNISVTNSIAAGSANITNDLVVQGNIANANNITTTNDLNVGGNIVTGTGSGGNISGVNYITANVANITDVVNTGAIANGTSNIRLATNGNVTISSNSLSNVFTFSDVGANVVGYIEANGLVTAGGFVGSNLVSNVGILSLSAQQGVTAYNINLLAGGAGNIDVGNTYITSVKNPANPQDAATKEYVDNISQGLFVHAPANVLTSSNLTATYDNGGTVLSVTTITGGKTITFSTNHGLVPDDDIEFTNSFNGIIAGEGYFVYSAPTLDSITIKDGFFGVEVTTLTNATGLTQPALGNGGVGATLTNSGANIALTIDSVLMTVGKRVLVTGQTNQFENGIYEVTTVGTVSVPWVLTRSTDGDSYQPKSTTSLCNGSYFFISQGSSYAGSSYLLTSPTGEIHIGTSNIVFTQFSAAGAYTSGNGIAINGTVISANVDNTTTSIIGGNIAVANSAVFVTPNIGAATGTSLGLTGNLQAGNVNSNAAITAVDATFSGNITTTGASGNISGANTIFADSFTSNGGTVDFATNNANVKLGNVGNVHIDGGSASQVLITDGAGNLSWSSAPNISIIQNGTSNVTIPTTNGNVVTDVNGNATLTVTSTGANLTGYANISGNIFAPAIVQNASTYDTRIELSSAAGIIQANTNGNVTQFLPGGSLRLPSAGASDIIGGTFDGSSLTLNNNDAILTQNRGGNVKVQVGTGGSIANTWTFANNGNTIFPAAGTANLGNVATANTVSVTNVNVGNSIITSQTTTTLSTGANQTIATFTVTGTDVVGVEFFVKGVEAAGLKYSVAMVQAVTDGAAVDYAIYGGVRLGGTTGALAVNMTSAGGNTNINLQVTPASSNSTVWTTQIRLV